MLIRRANENDHDRLEAMLIGALEIGFDPGPVVREKLFGPGFGGPAVCFVATVDEVIVGVSVICGSSLRLLAVAKSSRRQGIGAALLEHSVGEIARSHEKITVAAAAGNYLVPGIPRKHESAISFFGKRGFELAGEATDMDVSVATAERPDRRAGIEVERVSQFDDSLEDFLAKGFGRSIAWEIGRGIMSERSVVRVGRSSGAILGFTACEINNAGLGTFGPQGVSSEARGQGVGSLLLSHSLADLRELGYGKARIPWVSSTEYYARSCGASVAGEYVILRREL